MADVRCRGEFAGQEFLKLLQIMGNDFQDKIDLSIEHVAFPDLRQLRDMVFKGQEIDLCLTFQRHHCKNGDAVAERLGIEIGVIALDDPVILQRTDPAQAGRCRQACTGSKFDVGNTPVMLQVAEYQSISCVKLMSIWNSHA